MSITIKELRDNTGLSQKQFAEKFEIPLSTLRKWEQGESKPAPYMIKLLSELIPVDDKSLKTIIGRDGEKYYFNDMAGVITDSTGTWIKINTDIKDVKKENLPLYVKDLFDAYYEILEKFDRDCEFDKKDDIIWS